MKSRYRKEGPPSYDNPEKSASVLFYVKVSAFHDDARDLAAIVFAAFHKSSLRPEAVSSPGDEYDVLR